MPGIAAAARPCRNTAIAFLLCLLALSCAMEAKFAWYEPPAGPSIDARATKAIPSDTRDSTTDDSAQSDAACLGISCFLLSVFASAWLVTARRLPDQAPAPLVHHLPATQWFSPQISFRPPPSL